MIPVWDESSSGGAGPGETCETLAECEPAQEYSYQHIILCVQNALQYTVFIHLFIHLFINPQLACA